MIETLIQDWYVKQIGSTSFIILIPKKLLSIPYELKPGSMITGFFIGIKSLMPLSEKERKVLDELINTKIDLILQFEIVGSNDFFFFTNESWRKIRDYGIIPNEFFIKINITEATMDGESFKIYPKRDVIVSS